MCGIAGYIDIQSSIRETGIIRKMLHLQKHRGPNDTGINAFNLESGRISVLPISETVSVDNHFNGVLGFNRLSILDLSENGNQPMLDPDKKVMLTLNGEIYNAFDYRIELEQWGYNFKSTSDTEIILALYMKYGFHGMLERLNGMFAVIIVDFGLKCMYIVRDRFGIKPMYFINEGNRFAFSSELKSFRCLNDFMFELDEEQIDEFLIFRSNIKGTLLKGIQSLDPGHYLTYSMSYGLKVNKYFDINEYTRNNSLNGALSLYGEQMEEWLSKSVKSQLMSDVKLGCQLSGGVDSSLVTWLANKNSDKGKFEAVSIVFSEQQYNEEKYIDHVTRGLSIPSHKFLLDSDYYLNHIEKATWHLEVPLNHPNTVGIYKLSQFAKQYVTVLLSGEGADEVFGGYSRFYNINYPFRLRKLLHEVKSNRNDLQSFFDYFGIAYRSVMETAFMLPYLAQKVWEDFDKLKATESRIALYKTLNGSAFDRQVKYEMQTYLPDLLIRQDKMSMAHSIENRVPFLDNEVVKNSFTIPEKFLLLRKSPEGDNTEKYLMKKMAAKQFGTDFAFRDKMGFGIPVKNFFTEPRFMQYLNDKVFPGIRNRGIFEYGMVMNWISRINSLKYFEFEALWVIISFEIWASVYLDGDHENWNT
ncbi:MAG: asparagine synthase (glutamine-hydrolyzing) [bacterium]